MWKWLRCKLGFHYFREMDWERNGWGLYICKNPSCQKIKFWRKNHVAHH